MDIQQVMKQAQQMQTKMQEVQEALAQKSVEGQSGGGLVKVTLTGKGVVTGVSIADELLNKDEKEVLEDLVAAAFNDTKTKIEDDFQAEMAKVAESMGLPADFKLPM
ncbi:MAG: hypothetical protein COV36_04700 [Alphaproteobacteria bacterium CG11_big_fil_rev_8_21_14_0_20_44_7]|nr:MAG: hypothetical protein COV36_04700 [Alphaproteobacteria bacterium CG11_big_fil_rev_8_21_14_0_20_44_7]